MASRPRKMSPLHMFFSIRLMGFGTERWAVDAEVISFDLFYEVRDCVMRMEIVSAWYSLSDSCWRSELWLSRIT